MNRFASIGTFAACAAFAACVTGIEPPAPTAMVPIDGGNFLFGSEKMCFNPPSSAVTCQQAGTSSDVSGLPKTWPTVVVKLGAFSIDEHEVTNLQYRYCVALGRCTEPGITGTTGVEDYYGNPDFDDYPVFGITQDQAKAYCQWLGRRLPTEIEWERAAAGAGIVEASKRRVAISGGAGVLESCNAEQKGVAMQLCTGIGRPAPVMSSSDDWVEEGGRRIWDLTGNLSEWVDGAWVQDLTCQSALPASCDCWACGDNETCKGNCYTDCPDCHAAGDRCFTQCGDGDPPPFAPDGLPRCLRFPDSKEAKDLFQPTGADRPVRGGSFLTSATTLCKARTTDRSQKWQADKVRPEVGFRCADSP